MKTKKQFNYIDVIKKIIISIMILGSMIGIFFAGINIISKSENYDKSPLIEKTYEAHFDIENMRDGATSQEVADEAFKRFEFAGIKNSSISVTSDSSISAMYNVKGNMNGKFVPEGKLDIWSRIFEITNKPELVFTDANGSEFLNLTSDIIKESSASVTYVSGTPSLKMDFKDDRSKIKYRTDMNQAFSTATAPGEDGSEGEKTLTYNIWLDYGWYENALQTITNNDDYSDLLDEPYNGGDLFEYSFHKDLNGAPTSRPKDISKPFLIGQSVMIQEIDQYIDSIVLEINITSDQAKYFANRINFGTKKYDLSFKAGQLHDAPIKSNIWNGIYLSFIIVLFLILIFLIVAYGALGALAALGNALTFTITFLLISLAKITIGPILIIILFITLLSTVNTWNSLIKNFKDRINHKNKSKNHNILKESYKDTINENFIQILFSLIFGSFLLLFGTTHVQAIALVMIMWSLTHFLLFNYIFKALLLEIFKMNWMNDSEETRKWRISTGYHFESKNPEWLNTYSHNIYNKLGKIVSISIGSIIAIAAILFSTLFLTMSKGMNYTNNSFSTNSYEIALVNDGLINGKTIYEPDLTYLDGIEVVNISIFENDIKTILEGEVSNYNISFDERMTFALVSDSHDKDKKIVTVTYTTLIINTKDYINTVWLENELLTIDSLQHGIDEVILQNSTEMSNYENGLFAGISFGLLFGTLLFMAILLIFKHKLSSSFSFSLSVIIDVLAVLSIFIIFHIPVSIYIWLMIPITGFISVMQKSIINAKFEKEVIVHSERFISKETIDEATSLTIKSSWNRILIFNYSILLMGICFTILSPVLITIGLGLIFSSIVNQITSMTSFVWIRNCFEKIREKRKLQTWNNDLKYSKNSVSEQYIEDINY